MNNNFLITGMLRSGTTLLSSLVTTLPKVICHNQQLTTLFHNVKKDFLKSRGLNDYHLLPTYFPFSYQPSEFSKFLHSSNFSATYTDALNTSAEYISGDKEVLCEEFIEHFLENNIRVVCIIRNPKDVISSMHFGQGENFTGPHRPVLFDIRNWRKSVAFILKHFAHPLFRLVKYEDLVITPENTFRMLSDFFSLATDNLTIEIKPVSNSSFQTVSDGRIYSDSVDISKDYMSHDLEIFIEACCYREMQIMRYPVSEQNIFNLAAIEKFNDPFPCNRPEFKDFDYKLELSEEIQRLSLLNTDSLSIELQEKYFIFPEAYKALRLPFKT